MALSNSEWRKLYRLLDAHPQFKPTTENRAKLLRHKIITETRTQKGTIHTRTEWPRVLRLILSRRRAVADTERAELEALLPRLDAFWTENFGSAKEKKGMMPQRGTLRGRTTPRCVDAA